MSVFSILNPFKLYREIKNYFYWSKCLKKIEKEQWFEVYKYRLDTRFMRLYTVINIPEEFLNLPETATYKYIISDINDKVRPMFIKYNIFEICDFEFERIQEPNTFAYLIIYSYRWRILTLTNIFRFVFISTILLFVFFRYINPNL